MPQSPSPLPPKQAVLAGLGMMVFPFIFYFFAFWPVESFMELIYKADQGMGADFGGGLIMVVFLFGSFTLGVWEFSRGIFLLLFGDWYEIRQFERFDKNFKQRQEKKLLKERKIYARLSANQGKGLIMRNEKLRSMIKNIKKPFENNPNLINIIIIVIGGSFLIFIFTLLYR